MADPTLAADIAALRDFNRFYTRAIGVIGRYLGSEYGLAEVRVLYELAHRRESAAADLARDLGLDAGYLSRILKRFRQRGLVARCPAERDGRRHILALTPAGRRAFVPLERRSHDEMAALLRPLAPDRRAGLVAALATIRAALDRSPAAEPARPAAFVLRPHRPGDLGWVVSRHGALYAAEYGWDIRFEAMVAGIARDFIDNFKPGREACWMAERDGRILGSATLVEESKTVAKLRLVYVEPEARGLGLGRRLVEECERFARETRYRKIVLWTNSVLVPARALYKSAGYRLVARERHTSFGKSLIGEYWEKTL